MYICNNESLLTGGSSTHKTSAGARTGIVRCPNGHRPVPGRASANLLRDFFKFQALVRHCTMPGRSPYGARTGTVGIVRYISQTKIVQCPSDVCKRRPGAVRCPADVIFSSMTLSKPYERREILSST